MVVQQQQWTVAKKRESMKGEPVEEVANREDEIQHPLPSTVTLATVSLSPCDVLLPDKFRYPTMHLKKIFLDPGLTSGKLAKPGYVVMQ